MKKILTGLLAAATLSGGALATATPASAQHYGGYYGHRGGGNSAAIGLGAGLLGLAVGASLASPHYYSRPYYANGYYGGGYAPGYAYGGYPAPAYGYGYYARPACRSHWRFDPYIGRNVLVERCYR